MSKKHFIYLAECIKANREYFSDEAIDALIGFCRHFNGQFKTERFLVYLNGDCGPNGGKVQP